MASNLPKLILLAQFIVSGWASPLELTPRQADTSSDTGLEIGTTIPLLRSKHDLQHSSNALRKKAANLNFAQHAAAPTNYQSGYAVLRSTGASFLAPISFGSQSFLAIVDTGSADTWIASSDVQCLDITTGRPIPQSKCYFGPLYDNTKSGFKQIPNENFNITYGDGEFLTGPVGTIDLGLAGIKVPNQTVSIVDRAAWSGDGRTSGLIGLAFPALTAVYPGTDPRQDRYCSPGVSANQCNQLEYSSLTDNMFFQQKVARPVFALALSRDESGRGDGGYLTIGGIPQLDQVGVKNNNFASTDIKILRGDDRLRYYLIAVESLVMLPAGTPIPADGTSGSTTTTTTTTVPRTTTTTSSRSRTSTTRRSRPTNRPTPRPGQGGNNNGNGGNNWWQGGNWWGGGRSGNQKRDTPERPVPSGTNMQNDATDYIVDSGTTLSFIPDSQAKKFNGMFNPPATYDPYTGFFTVKCSAQIPPLGVKINGTVFWHNPKDLVKQYDTSGQNCISGIQSSNTIGVNILGDVFLDNVLAVFDLGQKVIKFAARRDYQS